MRPRSAIMSLAITVSAACGAPPPPEAVLTPPAGWSPESAVLPDDPNEVLRQATAQLESSGLQRSFWPRAPSSRAELESRGLIVLEGPCGPTIAAWVKAVPLDHPILQAERAIELDANGAALAEWPLPVYSVVAGIDGNRLLVPLRFWSDPSTSIPTMSITPSGDISIVAVVPDQDPEAFPCPAIRSYGDSAYLRCLILIDRTSREPRRIAYELPCT